MPDGANEPAAVPVPSPGVTGPAAGRRGQLLLGIGFGVGLALGVLLTTGLFATYTFFTDTLPATRDSVQVFNELNELRQQINQLNEEKKRTEQEKDEAVRQALSAVASTARAPDGRTPDVVPPAEKPNGGADRPPVAKRQDPFADIDAEIERLEQAQKVLNTILDMFSRKGKEPAKDR
jgi:hypothetical protein